MGSARKMCPAIHFYSHIVKELLQSPAWERVVTVGRRPWQAPHDSPELGSSPKLTQHVIDYSQLDSEPVQALFRGFDASFCALGTTRADAGSAVRADSARPLMSLPPSLTPLVACSHPLAHMLHFPHTAACHRKLSVLLTLAT